VKSRAPRRVHDDHARACVPFSGENDAQQSRERKMISFRPTKFDESFVPDLFCGGGLILSMSSWFFYALAAAVLYGVHQIFTRLASERIGDGIGGFIVEASAAFFILLYLAFLYFSGRWNQKFTMAGFNYSVLTGLCVGAGTIAFFLLFQKGGPLSAVPAILAGGAAIMVLAGLVFFHEPLSWQRVAGVIFAVLGLFLLRQ